MLLTGLLPIIVPDTRLLILGSMPGAESLKMQQYYAHPRNAFWFIIVELFGDGLSVTGALPDYRECCDILRRNQISLWDVLKNCVRTGSLDSDIRRTSETANPLLKFRLNHPELKAVAFNGRKARDSFKRHFLKVNPHPWCDLDFIDLPSTSPAYAALRPSEKLKEWRQQLQPIF